ncbi:MAG: hypothetical protein JWO31_2409 [Phycisphaerales bacterium]|nr:hypothetical protein [Phycisphaerales bacterium]
MSAEERSMIARQGGLARWSEDLPIAEHPGELVIAGRRIACAVLNNRKRVLAQHTFLTALGRSARPKGGTGSRRLGEGGSGLPPFLSAANLQPFISDELRESTTPIVFRTKSGAKAYGYDAMLLPMVCEVYLTARDAHLEAMKKGPEFGILQHMQEDVVRACDLLMRGLARVGIIALVDRATGFTDQQARDDLSKILEAYISPELMPWTRKFPPEFFKQVFKIHGWAYEPKSTKRPQYVGAFINDYVYKRLPDGVLEELRRLNPVTVSGHRRYKHTQFLSADTGNEHLDRQITAVTTIMRLADDKPEFKKLFTKAYPPLVDEVRKPLVIDVAKPDKELTLFPDPGENQ